MKLSILTATYNRGKYLQKLYDSIKENLKYNQNCEWIIVDDGSTDDTKTFVKKFKDENVIPIIYYYQKNNGKMSAINEAVKLATGNLIVDCDSDDYFVPDAFQKIEKNANKWWIFPDWVLDVWKFICDGIFKKRKWWKNKRKRI